MRSQHPSVEDDEDDRGEAAELESMAQGTLPGSRQERFRYEF
jgi:hypothetical protein